MLVFKFPALSNVRVMVSSLIIIFSSSFYTISKWIHLSLSDPLRRIQTQSAKTTKLNDIGLTANVVNPIKFSEGQLNCYPENSSQCDHFLVQ